jgi:hypothetical protein
MGSSKKDCDAPDSLGMHAEQASNIPDTQKHLQLDKNPMIHL